MSDVLRVPVFRRLDQPARLLQAHALAVVSRVGSAWWWWACTCRAGGSEPSQKAARAAWEEHRG